MKERKKQNKYSRKWS